MPYLIYLLIASYALIAFGASMAFRNAKVSGFSTIFFSLLWPAYLLTLIGYKIGAARA